jgi:hypothetical protein
MDRRSVRCDWIRAQVVRLVEPDLEGILAGKTTHDDVWESDGVCDDWGVCEDLGNRNVAVGMKMLYGLRLSSEHVLVFNSPAFLGSVTWNLDHELLDDVLLVQGFQEHNVVIGSVRYLLYVNGLYVVGERQ